MKILVNLPDYRHIHGGVTNHFVGLRPHWSENVTYNRIGKRREGVAAYGGFRGIMRNSHSVASSGVLT